MPQRAAEHSDIKIAVDAMGGDFAPEMAVKGAVLAARNLHAHVVLVGDAAVVSEQLKANNGTDLPIEVYHAPEKIGMGEEPYHLIRKKKRSSLRLAFELVRENGAHAVVSAGNSGAVVYGALFILKRLHHINRPGIGALMPSAKGPLLVIDAGANVTCKPQNLIQFAIMGSVYYRHTVGISNPVVAVLSNGEEDIKGTDLTRQANDLLKKSSLNYMGYVEARDVFSGKIQVVVCDGFVGNILIKASEGIAETVGSVLKEEIKSRFFSRLGYALARPSFVDFKKRFDYAEYGGAVLLGVDRPVIFGHGSSNAVAFMNAIRVAQEYVKNDINTKLIHELNENEDLHSVKIRHPFLNRILNPLGSKESD